MPWISKHGIMVAWLAGTALCGAAWLSTAGRADEAAPIPERPDPITLYMRDAAASAPGGPASQLVQRAREQGRVRVIVGLRVTMRPQHMLPPAEADRELRVLRAAQDAVARRVLGRISGDDIVRFDFIPFMSMWVDAAQVGRLLADPQVAVIQEDVPSRPSDTASIPLVHADKLWAKGDQGSGRTVAILDTGVAKNHPVLKGKIVSEACYSSNNGHTGVSFCPGGVTHTIATGSGVNCPVAIAGCEHGTHVASIAAAAQTASRIGIAPSANIIAMQVFTELTTTAACGGPAPCALTYDTDWIQGLQRVYALRNSYSIAGVNMSLGRGKFAGPCDDTNPAAATAIKTVRSASIAVLVASGNDGSRGSIAFPACISTAIAVGASTKPPDEYLADFSNDSDLVKLLAPGVDIYAAVPPNGYAVMSGTSMATPAVTGSYALLKQAKPSASVDDTLAALVCTAKILPVPNSGAPRIDLLGAYDRLLLPPQVVRSWDFTNAADGNDWTPQTGKWLVQGGAYKETVIKQSFLAGSSTDNCNHSLRVVASMERIDPNEAKNQMFSNSGIILKSKIDYSKNKYVSGYFIGYNNCPADKTGACGAGTEPGQTFIFRLDRYSFVSNSGGNKLLCEGHAPSNPKGFNTIKVVSQNNTHTYYLNGKLACKATDATYTVGPVMAVVAYAEASGSAFTLDSLAITSLDSAASAPAEMPVLDPESYAPKPVPAGMTVLGSRPLRIELPRSGDRDGRG